MPIFGERLHEQRLKNDMTLKEVANYIGVTEATVQRYESGNIHSPKHNIISKLASLFRCEPSYLMGWEDTPTPANSRPNILDTGFITKHELKIIDAYRSKPDMQQAVDTLLNVQRDQNLHIVKKAARNGKYEVFTLTDDEFQKMKAADEALEDAPDNM